MTHQALQDVREVLEEAVERKQDLGAIIMNLHLGILINHLLVNVSGFLESNLLCLWIFCMLFLTYSSLSVHGFKCF